MIGDYYRYVAESAQPDKLEEVKNGALDGYKKAEQLSKTLNACNPIRLGLALNFSVFYYEVMNDHKRARLKDKLSDNFLLKRSSDVILIIVAVSTSLLLLGAKKTENNS